MYTYHVYMYINYIHTIYNIYKHSATLSPFRYRVLISTCATSKIWYIVG